MISEIIVPDLGATGGDVTLLEWLVKPGERIKAGQPIFVLSTDKATVEVEAFRDGVVRELWVAVGEIVPLGSVVGFIADTMDEQLEKTAPQVFEGITPQIPVQIEKPAVPVPPIKSGGRIFATPLARRIAAEEGIDLSSVNGSGKQAQILKRDVLAALEIQKSLPQEKLSTDYRQEPLSSMQRAISERTVTSKTQIPHFYASTTVDMGAARELRQQISESLGQSERAVPSITDLCIRAVALALKQFPSLNASFDGDSIRYYSVINIGMIVGLEKGMIVPVIRNADRLNLLTLAGETSRLRKQAEAGQLHDREITGGTFTISNLGMYGLDSFTAIINPPQAGILALGAIKDIPANFNGVISLRPLMIANLSVDHRVVDGIAAARFLQVFQEILENPVRLVLDT